MEDRWLSVDDISDYLGVKRDTVYPAKSLNDADRIPVNVVIDEVVAIL